MANKNLTALYLSTALVATLQLSSQNAYAFSFDKDNLSHRLSFSNSLVDAAEYGDIETLRFLLKSGENPNQRGDFETTALLRAAYQGNMEAVKLLLSYDANPNLADIGGATPLHIASREGNQPLVDLLIKTGANINIADKEGYTPLMRASINGDDKLLKGLVKLGAAPELKNEFGETALSQAAKSKNEKAVTILMAQEEKLQADIDKEINIAAAKANKLEELIPASGSSSWSKAVSNELFGSEFMLMAIAETKATNPSGTFNLLDFGSYETEQDARKKLDELKTKHADILKGMNILVVEKSSGGNTKYHINAGIVETKEEAVAKCKALIAKNVVCRPTETKMMLAAKPEPVKEIAAELNSLGKPEPSLAEAAPAPEVSKTILEPVAKPAAKTIAKPEEKTEVANVEPKVEAKAETKLETKADIKEPAKEEVKTPGNAGSFDFAENNDKEESFFGSLFSSDEETKLEEPKLPDTKSEKTLLVKEDTKQPEIKKPEVKSEPKAEIAKAESKTLNPLLQAIEKPTTATKADVKAESKIEIAKSEPVKEPIKLEEPKPEIKAEEPKPEIKAEEPKPEKITLPPIPVPAPVEKPVDIKPAISESKAKPETKPVETVILEAKPTKKLELAAAPEITETKTKTLPPLLIPKEDKAEVEELAPATKITEEALETPAPIIEAPRIETPIIEAPRIETPIIEVPKVEAPKAELLKPEMPRLVAPKLDTPKVEEPRIELPKPALPKLVSEPNVAKPEISKIPEIAAGESAPQIITPQAKQLDNVANNYMAGKPSLTVSKSTKPTSSVPAAAVPSFTKPAAQVSPQPVYVQPTQPQVTYTEPANTPVPSYVSPNQVVVQKSAPVQSNAANYNYTPLSTPAPTTAPVVAPVTPVVPITIAQPKQVAPSAAYLPSAKPASTPIAYQAPVQAVNGELWVNVGYFNNQSTARGFWNRVMSGGNSSYTKYRMRTKRPYGDNGKVSAEIGPIYNTADASDLCNKISSEGLSCTVIRGTSTNSNILPVSRHATARSDAFNYNVVGDEISSYGYNNWSIQLGTYDSMNVANNVWENLKGQHRILSDMEHKISRSDNGSSKLRLRAGSFTSAEAAENTCAELRRNFISCIIVRSN